MNHALFRILLALISGLIVLSCTTSQKSEQNLTPTERLIQAASRNETSEVKIALGKGLSPNSLNILGMTPMMAAAFKGHIETMELLSEYGADIARSDNQGTSALHYAVQGKKIKAVEYLIKECKKLESSDCLSVLNAKDQFGLTPLIFASHLNQPEIAKSLLEGGANINEKNEEGWTPLFFAASKGYFEIISFFLQMKADFEAQDIEGNTPLFLAVESGNLDSVIALQKAGANFNHKNASGKTITDIAYETKNPEMIKLVALYGPR